MKRCPHCAEVKTLDQFNKNKKTKDGLHVWCRECFSKYNKARYESKKEAIKAAVQKYRLENAPKVSDNKKRWYAKNAAVLNQRSKANYHANKEYYAQKHREWVANNRGKQNYLSRKWAANNLEKRRLIAINCTSRRRTKTKEGNISKDLTAILMSEQGGMCPGCLVVLDVVHFDHIMPLVLGGEHTNDNIQLLCPSCNLRKSDKHPLRWYVELEATNI